MSANVELPASAFVPPDPLRDLEIVHSTSGDGLYASAGARYGLALFGRDMAESALDLLGCVDEVPGTHDIARDVILTMTRLLGTRDAPSGLGTNEERFGKAHHEARSLMVDGRRVPAHAAQIFDRLAREWGGAGGELAYYGSIDVTFQYVRLVAAHCRRYGLELLDRLVTGRDGIPITVEEGVRRALRFTERQLRESDVGLVEYLRTNPRGHESQTWKDSATAYLFADGRLANCDAPVAPTEVQALAYDSLLDAAGLLEGRSGDAAAPVRWRALAGDLRGRIFQRLWMAGPGYFATGIDRDPHNGSPRVIDALSSDGAKLLDSSVFDGLAVSQQARYVGGIVRTICSPDFVTAVGLRCRALRHAGLLDFLADYHGSLVSWPKETNDISRGLRRQGFGLLAGQLDARIVNGVRVAGHHWEYFYVAPDGRVNYDPGCERPARVPGERVRVVGSLPPDAPQTWTVTAVLEAEDRLQHSPPATTARWKRELERELLGQIPVQHPLLGGDELRARYYATGGDFECDTEEFARREPEIVQQKYRLDGVLRTHVFSAGLDAHEPLRQSD